MNTKIIFISMLLSGCSLIGLKQSEFIDQKTNKPTIDERNINNKNKNDKNVTATNSPIVVEPIDDAVSKVEKNPTTKTKIPDVLLANRTVYFELDQYIIQDMYLPQLKKHAEFLVNNPNEFIFIEGHTDERGSTEYNLALGQRRSDAVRKVLSLYGVPDRQMEAYSYGKEKPKMLGSNEAAWSQNRRVELEYRY